MRHFESLPKNENSPTNNMFPEVWAGLKTTSATLKLELHNVFWLCKKFYEMVFAWNLTYINF
jgi:hypothetical protein